MKLKSFFLFFLCLFLVTACSDKEAEPSFVIEGYGDLAVTSGVGSVATLSFTSTREWKASCSADWLSVSPLSGESGKVTITVTTKSENSTTLARSATLVLSSGTVQKEIALTQEAGEEGFIEPDWTEYGMFVEGGVLDIIFSTNMGKGEYSIYSSNVDWLNQEVGRSVDRLGVRLNVLANTGENSRSAEFTFVSNTNSKIFATVKINQAGKSTPLDHKVNGGARILQTASEGSGIPIIIMGDGFTQAEINDGTYDKVIDKACENLFTEESIKSLRDYFNVYAVTAISRNNTFGSGSETIFGCKLEGGNSTGISGDDEIIQKYAQRAGSVNLDNALVVVILNTPTYAGTTYFGYSRGGIEDLLEFAIAYCPVIDGVESENFRRVLTHEAVGHGFAKLDDEYAYPEKGTMPVNLIAESRSLQAQGWLQNVDFTSDPTKVLWSVFLTDDRYKSEGLGVFVGACTYATGAYRPSEESMMRENTHGFNAPSRREIYDKVMEMGKGATPGYEEFVAFDMLHKPQVRGLLRARTVAEKPFARPRFVKKSLRF